MTQNKHRTRKRLEERRAEIEAASAGAREDRRPVELDQQAVGRISRVDALQRQQMAQETERRRQLELRAIEAALRRLDEGTYGECVSCGERIAERRLELDPATPICIECLRERER